MEVTIKDNGLYIEIDLEKPTPSSSGKTLVVASSHGNMVTSATYKNSHDLSLYGLLETDYCVTGSSGHGKSDSDSGSLPFEIKYLEKFSAHSPCHTFCNWYRSANPSVRNSS